MIHDLHNLFNIVKGGCVEKRIQLLATANTQIRLTIFSKYLNQLGFLRVRNCRAVAKGKMTPSQLLLLLLFRHSAKSLNAQEERLAIPR